ncbi:MgtC/SapB family protein [Azospira restricta]|uniref:MgtC/SapB family protein n=1 Tax=Azospira restricta TaxID=404405 RepID=A0A974SMU9_9RHOO|nr:MgtC/SapB family protein [Azospira restricta]QRJ62589.1 MgtC/SapB family protein [Azospira restricta]
MGNSAILSDIGLEFIQAFLLALGIGMLLGLERERNPASRAGLRTFGLVTLLGAVCALIAERTGSPWLLPVGLLVVGAMMIAAYHRQPDANDPGTTSVVALLLAFCYGAMVWYGLRTLAVMLAILTTVLLYFKAELQTVSQRLTRRDITSVLQFGVLSLVILPILPDRNFGPYDTLNPAQVWWMVVLISGVGLCGYAALRLVGQRYGAPLLGVLGGLASSTATTLVFARHARATASLTQLALVVILTANLIVLVRLAGVAAIVQPDILPALLPILGSGLLAGLAFVAWAWHRLGRAGALPELELRNPTELGTALTFAAVYAVVLLLSAALSERAGSLGLYAVALVSGLTDVDAITLSSLRLFGQGKLAAGEASTAILIAVLANLLFKLGIVAGVAGRHLALRIVGGFSGVAAGCLAGWFWA